MDMKSRVDNLTTRYQFDIHDFLTVYKEGLSRELLAASLDLSLYSIKSILAGLMLPVPKGKRKAGFDKFYRDLNDVQEDWDPQEATVAENTYLDHKLGVTERALQRSRDEANHLRAAIRNERREASLEERVLDLLEGASPIKRSSKITVNVGKKLKAFEDHIPVLLLSDLHVEESIEKKVVGLSNEFNWEIMERRLNVVFEEWFDGYRGEDRAIVLCGGDFISGTIHDTLLSTTKPTMEAVQDLSDILADHIAMASKIYKHVTVPCVSGNHERLSEHLRSQNKGFDFGYILYQLLKAKLRDCTNVSVEISTTGHIVSRVGGGKAIGLHHGDQYRGKGDARNLQVIEGFKNICGEDVSIVCQGHTHQFVYDNHYTGATIVNGNLVGANSYAIAKGFIKLRPSQTIFCVLPNGDIEYVRQVFLDV